MMDKNHIVAIGLLTQRDLDRLGDGFKRMFPADASDDFQDLLDAIDRADISSKHANLPHTK